MRDLRDNTIIETQITYEFKTIEDFTKAYEALEEKYFMYWVEDEYFMTLTFFDTDLEEEIDYILNNDLIETYNKITLS